MKYDWIIPNVLAAGPLPMTTDELVELHQQGIRAVVTLTEQPLTTVPTITPQLVARLSLTLFHSPIMDYGPPSSEQANAIVDEIYALQAQNKPIYLHCHAGVGRTGTMLHAYFLRQGMTLPQAVDTVQRRRIASSWYNLSPEQRAFLDQFAQRIAELR